MAGLTITAGNNEGAIKDSPYARSQPGYRGSRNGFAIFDDKDSGVNAQVKLLSGERYSGLPIATIIAGDGSGKRGGYAPLGPENSKESVNNYIHYVAQRTGIDPRQPVPKDKIPTVAAAMREFETGRTQPVKKREETFADGITAGLQTKEAYKLGPPTRGETNRLEKGGEFGIAGPDSVDESKTGGIAQEAVSATEEVATFMRGIVEPIRQNSQAIVAETQAVAATKHRLADDIESRGTTLLEQMKPLQERRRAIMERMRELDAMSPFERKLKAAFNSDYDYRVLEGRMARADTEISLLEEEYKEVNTVKAGIAGALIEADAADVDVLSAKSNSLLAEARLLGQVSGAIRDAADIQLYPLGLQMKQMGLQAEGKARLVGNMTTEAITDAYLRARDSESGTVVIDGVELGVGELQTAARSSQQSDMSFRNMENALAVNDMQTADAEETRFIDHLSPEALDVILKNGGMHNGKQLSLSKLTSALERATTMRTANVNQVVTGTIVGNAGAQFKQFGQNLRDSGSRASQIFGNVPQELVAFGGAVQIEMKKFNDGLVAAKERGVEEEYIAAYMPQLSAMQTAFDAKITEISKKWAGGKAELAAVAESWMRGNPLSGDAAIKGLITMARSGMPARLEGPAAAAVQAAVAVVRDWDSPESTGPNASLEEMLSPRKKTQEELTRRVQRAVQTVYTDNLTNELFNSIPDMSRQVRDDANPGKMHPFSRVSKEEFQQAVRFGDNEGYEMVANKMGINGAQAAKLFREGPDGALWKQVATKNGYQMGQFADFQEELQAAQQAATLQALDSGPAARDGFKPGAAFVDFMTSKAVSNKVDQIVQSYGQSGFGPFIVSSSAGGGYRDGWAAYGQGLATTYQQLNAKELRQRIESQRGLFSDPTKRMNVVLGAAGLSKQESQILSNAAKQVAGINESPIPIGALAAENLPMARLYSEGGFDKLSYVVQNHKFEDPQVERIRQKAARSWSDMNAVISLIEESAR